MMGDAMKTRSRTGVTDYGKASEVRMELPPSTVARIQAMGHDPETFVAHAMDVALRMAVDEAKAAERRALIRGEAQP